MLLPNQQACVAFNCADADKPNTCTHFSLRCEGKEQDACGLNHNMLLSKCESMHSHTAATD